jgi:multidrug efflux pump subunit AcrB
VPSEDQGYFIGAALLPDGATLDRTRAVAGRLEKETMADPLVEHMATINGFDFIGGGSNGARSTSFVMLKRWNERKRPGSSVEAALGGFFGRGAAIREAFVVGFNPPPIQGLGSTGGFEVYVQNRGEGDTAKLAQVTDGLIAKLNQDPKKRFRRRVHALPRQLAADQRQARSREGQGSRRLGRRCVRHSADRVRVAVRERLRQSRPGVPRADAGRCGFPLDGPRTCRSSTSGPRAARWCSSPR